MPALKPTQHTCKIVYLGRVADRDADLASEPLTEVTLRFGGVEGEAHGGVTRASCSRVISQHPRGTTVANVRQLSVVSVEEMQAIASEMGIDRLEPAWIGASLMIEGLPEFTHIPPSSRLQAPSGATLVIDMENRPCHLPAAVIDRHIPDAGRLFKSAARGRRGVTAWVEREGLISIGDILTLHVPDQPAWSHI
ncbi:MAG: MOSC domain-containing protein [Pseudomonadota bacterium]